MSDKPFSTIDEQVNILQRRGLFCDEKSAEALIREGYYAIVNGYKEPFLDTSAPKERYKEGTQFSELYSLFRFDRDLRAITFRYLMCAESLLRSLISYSFCEIHKDTEAYLRKACYTEAAHYLRGEERLERDLEWMIDTLERHAKGIEADEPGKKDGSDVRVAYYREVHGGVPLWVLFCELSFGNLKYFYALMKKAEQKAVCRRLVDLKGDDELISRENLFSQLELLVAGRNVCAHGERLYNSALDGKGSYCELIEVLAGFLAHDERRRFSQDITGLIEYWQTQCPTLRPILAATSIEDSATSLVDTNA